MRRRFFVDEVRSGRAELSGDDARHLTRVLRVEAGQRYEISDNCNVYLAEVETARKEHVAFRTLEKLPAPAETVRLVLCAALIKFDHFEWMIEKATELGVSEIVPVETIRSDFLVLPGKLTRRAGRNVLQLPKDYHYRQLFLNAAKRIEKLRLPELKIPKKARLVRNRK